MTGKDDEHTAAVKLWASRGPRLFLPGEVLGVYQRALGALWDGARSTVSGLSLAAVLERALLQCAEERGWLDTIRVTEEGADWKAVSLTQGAPDAIEEDLQRVLATFMRMLGAITNEVMTPYLHETLAKVAREPTPNVYPMRKADTE